MVEQVLEPIRPKFVLATKAEVMLKKVDDTIDSPDPSDIERELDRCADEVQEKNGGCREADQFSKIYSYLFSIQR